MCALLDVLWRKGHFTRDLWEDMMVGTFVICHVMPIFGIDVDPGASGHGKISTLSCVY